MISADVPRHMDVIDAEPGELVNLRDGLGDVLAIRLPTQSANYLVLSVDGKPLFVTGRMRDPVSCLNYGKYWDIVLDELQPGWEKGEPIPGAILIGSASPAIQCGKSEDYRTPAVIYDVKSLLPTSRQNYGDAWFGKWSLWWSPDGDWESRRHLVKFDVGSQ